MSIKNCSVGIVGVDQEFIILEDDKLATYVSTPIIAETYNTFICILDLQSH